MAAHVEYEQEVSVHYDDALTEVSSRVRDARSVGKADVGALVMWKRMRADTPWAGQFIALPEQHVREVTERAVRCAHDESLSVPEAAIAGRRELFGLPGFKNGDALASAVLLVAAPTRMAIYDRRAQAGLKRLDLTLSPGRAVWPLHGPGRAASGRRKRTRQRLACPGCRPCAVSAWQVGAVLSPPCGPVGSLGPGTGVERRTGHS